MNETDLIQALVLQFLQHDGYVETARAFAQDMKVQKEALNIDPNIKVDGLNIRDDEDANNRQREFSFAYSLCAISFSNTMQVYEKLSWKAISIELSSIQMHTTLMFYRTMSMSTSGYGVGDLLRWCEKQHNSTCSTIRRKAMGMPLRRPTTWIWT